MESLQNDAVFLEDDDEVQEYEQEEEEHDDILCQPDDDDNQPSITTTSFVVAMPAVPVSVVSNASSARAVTVAAASPEPKGQHMEQFEEKKALDDSRRLFQRLWTDEDEIGLLQGFLDYTAKRGSSHHNDTALFYDQIKSKLQLDFNKNQLVEKLRRLKKKYRNAVNKIASGKEFSFKSPHDQATFEISRKIWNNSAPIGGSVEDDDEINLNPNSAHTTPLKNDAVIEKKTPRKRSRMETEVKRELSDSSPVKNNNNNNNSDNKYYYNGNTSTNDDNCNGRNSVQGLIEETVRSCLSPVLKELASNAMGSCRSGFGGRGFELNTMPLRFCNLGSGETLVEEKWRKQQILELEVYSKRLELVQDEIKVALEELQSAGAGGVDKV